MRIPKKFKLLGLEYTVEFREVPNEDTPNAWAVTLHKQQKIIISSKLGKKLQEQTFVHELMHVVYLLMGLDQSTRMTNDQEEVVVNCFANGLFAIIESGLFNV